MTPKRKCSRCFDTRWICEQHGRAWEGHEDGCGEKFDCAGPGEPCPDCNSDPNKMPDPIPGSEVTWINGNTVH